MALIRVNPWYEMGLVQRQLNRLFDDLTTIAPQAMRQEIAWVPAIELHQTEAGLVLKVELPGVNADDLEVQVTRDVISLKGERRSQLQEGGRTEFRYGKFHRVVSLPVEVDQEQATAQFQDGILTLTLPRFEAVRPKVVKLSLNTPSKASAVESATPAAPAQPVGEPATPAATPSVGTVADPWIA